MKKIKFAVQVFILMAAFPVLFVLGITHSTKPVIEEKEQLKSSTVNKNAVSGRDCYCYNYTTSVPVKMNNNIIKY